MGATFLASYFYVVYAGYTAAPFWDSWLLFLEDRNFYRHIITDNEHIINFTALIFWIDNSIFAGRGILQLSIIAGMLLTLSTLFYREIARIEPRAWGTAAFLVAACLSATQYTNIVWPFQVGFAGCFVLGTAAIRSLSRAADRPSPAKWLAVSLILAFLSAFGLAAGIILLAVLALYVLVLSLGWITKLIYAAVAGAGVIVLVLLSGVDRGGYGAKSLFGSMEFSAVLLGSLFGAASDLNWLRLDFIPDHVLPSAFAGTSLCIFILAAAFWAFRRIRFDGEKASKYWPLCVAAWVMLSAAAIGYSRSGLPVSEAMSARYVTLSVLLMGASLLTFTRMRPGLARRASFNFFLLGAVGLLLVAQIDRMAQSEVAGRRNENAESALLNSAFASPDLNNLYPPSMDASVRRVAEVMKLRGISVFGESRYRIIGKNLFAGALEFVGSCPSRFSEVIRADAYIRVQGEPANARTGYPLIEAAAAVVADRASNVLATGTLRKPMLGLREEGRQHGFVINLAAANCPEAGKASLFLVDFAGLKFCYAGTF